MQLYLSIKYQIAIQYYYECITTIYHQKLMYNVSKDNCPTLISNFYQINLDLKKKIEINRLPIDM